MKRTENSIRNSIVAIVSSVFVMVLGFVIQTVFVKTLGEEYLGINGLFANIVSMLAIVELGIGPAIVSNLYKPLAEGNTQQIKTLLRYYRNCYHLIGLLVFGIGLLVMPFLPFLVNTELTFPNFGGISFLFFLFVVDAALSYFYSYKRSIIQADQKNWIINLAHLICYTLMVGFQIGILLLTKNYVLFLVIRIFFRVLENVILSLIVDKQYPYLKGPADKIQPADKQDIFTKIKGLIYHKIGGYIVLGTDNIIISVFLGVGLVGLYSNYYLVINSLYLVYCQIFSSVTASVGNMLVTESKDANYAVYKKLMFLNFWIYGFSAAALCCMMTPFITLWLGDQFLLPGAVLIILVVNFYMLGMRSSVGSFKDAAGIFYEDRFIPILESVINIVTSLILVYFFGMFGVFLGTFCSSLLVAFYSLPKYVFQKVFQKPKRDYYRLYFLYAAVTALACAVTYGVYALLMWVCPMGHLLSFVCAGVISAIVPNGLFMLLFRKTAEYGYFKQFVLSKFRRRGTV